MGRTKRFATQFNISDCGARFAVEDYCYPMLMGSAALVKASAGFDGDHPGRMVANLQASFYPELIMGTSLGLVFPLLIHLSEIQSGPIYPWSLGNPTDTPRPLPYAPSPYRPGPPPQRPMGGPHDGPWRQHPLDRYPCPRPLSRSHAGVFQSDPSPHLVVRNSKGCVPPPPLGGRPSRTHADPSAGPSVGPEYEALGPGAEGELLVGAPSDGNHRVRPVDDSEDERLIAQAG